MNIQDLASSAAGPLKHVSAVAGGEWAGACPKCGGQDRFRVWPEHPKGTGGRFWCRECGWQGDGIQFAMDTEGLSYSEACRLLGTAPKSRRSLSMAVHEVWTPKASLLPGSSWAAAAEKFVEYAEARMAASETGRAYAASRGLTPATVAALKIGWSATDLYHERNSWGLADEINERTGRPRKVWLPAGLVIPTIRDGVVVAVKIRRTAWTPEDELPKYAAVSGSSVAPMVLSSGKDKSAVIVESELDAILCAQEARDIVTAIAMRTARAKPDAEAHKLILAAPVVLVATDADEAGATAYPWWRSTYPKAVRWLVTVGKDVGDLMAEAGRVRNWILAGLPDAMPEPPVEPAPVPETISVAGLPSPPRRPPAHGEPCPYSDDQLAAFRASYPHLVCCPQTRPPWNWRYAEACSTRCNNRCNNGCEAVGE